MSSVIESYKLPYLDPIPLLPITLSLHLTSNTKRMLSPSVSISTRLEN